MSFDETPELPIGELGYAIELEKRDELDAKGADPELMLRAAKENLPTQNPYIDPTVLFDILNQGSQGSCQGHALAMVMQICYYLATGRKKYFSRAAAYYLSQRKDGIRGDRGSTLNGGRWVATEHGLCEEHEWPYPSRYNPREPSGIDYRFKLVSSRPTRDIDLAWEWLQQGLPIQGGQIWDSSMSREIVTSFRGRGGGGHSTCWWSLKENSQYGDLATNMNSWGSRWNGDGCHHATRGALKQILEHRYSTFVLYGWEGMIYPDLSPVDFGQ